MDYEKLKRQNAADTATLDKPYQPVVYAIPEEHWTVMMRLMKQMPEILSASEQCRNQLREVSSQAGRIGAHAFINKILFDISSDKLYLLLPVKLHRQEGLAGAHIAERCLDGAEEKAEERPHPVQGDL